MNCEVITLHKLQKYFQFVQRTLCTSLFFGSKVLEYECDGRCLRLVMKTFETRDRECWM